MRITKSIRIKYLWAFLLYTYGSTCDRPSATFCWFLHVWFYAWSAFGDFLLICTRMVLRVIGLRRLFVDFYTYGSTCDRPSATFCWFLHVWFYVWLAFGDFLLIFTRMVLRVIGLRRLFVDFYTYGSTLLYALETHHWRRTRRTFLSAGVVGWSSLEQITKGRPPVPFCSSF